MFNLTRELFFSNELADIDARLASGDSLQNATASKPDYHRYCCAT